MDTVIYQPLTAEDIDDIKNRYLSGRPVQDIAKEVGRSYLSVRNILRNHHISSDPEMRAIRKEAQIRLPNAP